MGISCQTFSGTPPGSLVVGVGGGVPVRVTEIDESVPVFAEDIEGVALRTSVLVVVTFTAETVDPFPGRPLVTEFVLATVNRLVP